jgi:hypothetical protein
MNWAEEDLGFAAADTLELAVEVEEEDEVEVEDVEDGDVGVLLLFVGVC